jgi:hypothetical protein
MTLAAVGALLAGCATSPEGSSGTGLAARCDRACLEGHVDAYLEALVANDPSRLRLARDVRYTENGVALEVGEATWRTADGIGTYRHVFADPDMGQVGFYGTIREHGVPAVLVLRMKIERDGAISEIETLMVRNEAQARRAEEVDAPIALWTTPTPPAERLSREDLIRAADSYFTGLENNDGRGVYPFSDDCNRLENATYTTNSGGTDFSPALTEPYADANIGALGCREQFETGYFFIDTEIRDRRYPVVDVERQAVMSFIFFDHDGKWDEYMTLADGSRRRANPHIWTWRMSEAFRIRDGELAHINAWMMRDQYGARPGWDGDYLDQLVGSRRR